MVLKILLGILLFIDSYLIVMKIKEIHLQDKINQYVNHKSEKYYEDLLKFYEKNKKIKLKTKMGLLQKITLKMDRAGVKSGVIMNPFTIIIASLLSVMVSYILCLRFFKVMTTSFLISAPMLFFPFFVLQILEEYRASKVEKAANNFLLQLKNYTQINNDIVYALGEVKTIEPLQGYIHTFLLELNRGIRFEVAMEHFKEKLHSETLKMFLSNVQYCYLYGGSFSKLITKSYFLFNQLQQEKEKRMNETKSARLVLYILVILDMMVYVVTIRNHAANEGLMQKTMIGKAILNWNFISMWLLIMLANKVKKLDY